MKTFREFLLLFEGQQEDLGIKILTQADKLDVLDKLKQIDETDSNKYLPVLAHYYTAENVNIALLEKTFKSYQEFIRKKQLEVVQYTKRGIKYGNEYVDWKRFSQIVHAAESRDTELGDIDTHVGDNLTPIWSNDRYKIFLADSKQKCIQLGDGQSFCISDPDPNYNEYNNYRFEYEITFYFIYDSEPYEDDQGIVVIGVHPDGEYDFTTMRNETVEADNGGTEEFEDYLLLHPEIPEDLFEPVGISEKEQEIKDRFADAEFTDSEFSSLTNDEKTLYIENGGKFNLKKWKMLSSKQKNTLINLSKTGLPIEIVWDMNDPQYKRYKVIVKRYIDKKTDNNDFDYRFLDTHGKIFISGSYGNKWVLDENNDLVFEPNQEVEIIDRDGTLKITNPNGKSGLYDLLHDNYWIEPKYDNVSMIDNNNISVVKKDGKVGYLEVIPNGENKWIVEPNFNQLSNILSSYGYVAVAESKKGMSVIRVDVDNGGFDYLTDKYYDVGSELPKIHKTDTGIIVIFVSKNGKHGAVNIQNGDEIVETKYDSVKSYKRNYLILEKDRLKGLYHINLFKKVIPVEYEYVGYNRDDADNFIIENDIRYDNVYGANELAYGKHYVVVEKGGKEGLFKTTGEEVLEPKFDKILHKYGDFVFVVYKGDMLYHEISTGLFSKSILFDNSKGRYVKMSKKDWKLLKGFT